ncbi:MAG: Gfo/Idh/MocA family oxidoreductase [Planctomycetota bacterium]|nr:Gfo/Idh/MocA family oxidoreductase [Planctomycetota bacterium]
MSSRPLRIGLLGFGGVVARFHVPALKAHAARCEIAAVARGDANRLAEAKTLAGTHRGYADWRELVADPDLDAVLIASPNALHADQAVAALEAGKDVLCEKPPAMNAAEAERMAAAAVQHGRVLRYGFLLRYADESVRAKAEFDAGRLGEVYHVRARWFRRRGYPTQGSWFTTKRLSGGGVLADLGSHLLDRALWLLGYPRIEAVSAVTHARLRESKVVQLMKSGPKSGNTGICDVEDLAVCLFRLGGGASLILECSFAVNLPETPFSTDLLGDRAGLRLRPGQPVELFGEDGGAVTDTSIDPKGVAKDQHNLYERQIRAFLDAVQARDLSPAHPREGVALMRALEAAYASAERGREVGLGS